MLGRTSTMPASVVVSERRGLTFPELVDHLAHAVGIDNDPERVRSAVELAKSMVPTSAPWSERVTLACRELGIPAEVHRGTVQQAAAAVGPSHPIVAVLPSGRYLLVMERRGRKLLVEGPEIGEALWLSVGEVSARIDPEQLGAVDWVAVDPPGLFRSLGEHQPTSSNDHVEHPTPMQRLRKLVLAERHDLGVVLVYAAGVGVLALATPIAVEVLVNTVAFGTLRQPLVVLTMLLAGGLAFSAALRALQAWVVEILQRRLFLRLVSDLAYRLPRVRLSAFDRANGPELLNHYFDVFTIQKAAATLLLDGLDIVLAAAVGLTVLAFYHPYLLAFDAVLLATIVFILWFLGRGATGSAVQESYAKYDVAGFLEEVARHPVAFKLSGGAELARRRADDLTRTYLTERAAHFRVVFRQMIGALFLYALSSAGVLGIGGFLVIERQLTLGQLVAAELIVTTVVASFAKIGKHLETFYDLLAALDKVGQLTDLPLESQGDATEMPPCPTCGAVVELSGLSFGFPGRPGVLKDVTVTIDSGERVALEGLSGSGRSALVDLLVGLREPSAGRLEIDQIDVRDVHKAALRERAALVRGDEVIIGTIFENVAFGRSMDHHAVREALETVDLLDVVASWTDGLNTLVHSTGAPLSQGQAVRLAIARAIAGRPRLLIIDRALDGMDPVTREAVLDRLFLPSQPWTLVVVTDDPHVAERCHRRFSLDDGTLIEGEKAA